MKSPPRIPLESLARARDAGIITPAQHEALMGFVAGDIPRDEPIPPAGATPSSVPVARFDLVHVLWYAGGLIVIGAMGLFTTVAF